MKTILSKASVWLVSSALIFSISFNSHSVIIASEYFDYADGPLSGQNGGTGWNGGWTGAGDVASGEGAPAFNNDASFRQLANTIGHGDGESVYLSFDINSSIDIFQAFAGLSFYGAGTEEVFIGKTFFDLSLGIDVTGLGALPTNGSETSATLVTEILFGAADTTFNLFVDPVNMMTSETLSWTVSTGVLGGSWDAIRLASGGTGDLMASFDNIVIATAKQDVLLPEPSTLGLFVLAGVFFLRRQLIR